MSAAPSILQWDSAGDESELIVQDCESGDEDILMECQSVSEGEPSSIDVLPIDTVPEQEVMEDCPVLEFDFSEDEGGQGSRSSSWVPGLNCGSFISPVCPLMTQAQVLLVNTVANVRKLPQQLRKAILPHLPQHDKHRGKSCSNMVAAGLLGIARQSVVRCFRDVENNGLEPVHREELHPAKKTDCKHKSASGEDSGGASKWHESASALVRTAIAGAVEGRSHLSFERDIARLRLCGVEVDAASCHSRHFCREVEFLTVQVLHMISANEWASLLPGLGVPSDFSLMVDPVTLGENTAFPRNETVSC